MSQSVLVAVEVIASVARFVMFVSIGGEVTVQVGESWVVRAVEIFLVVLVGVGGVGVVQGRRDISGQVTGVVGAEVEDLPIL